jgi:hypothetical protein
MQGNLTALALSRERREPNLQFANFLRAPLVGLQRRVSRLHFAIPLECGKHPFESHNAVASTKEVADKAPIQRRIRPNTDPLPPTVRCHEKLVRRSKESISAEFSRNAIEGRPPIHSNVTNVLLPARKFGCPHESVSVVSGSERHKSRSLWSAASADFMATDRGAP